MRIARIVLLILGILAILFNILGYIAGARPFQDDPTGNTAGAIGYFIGTNLFFIIGGIFFAVAFPAGKVFIPHFPEPALAGR